MEVPTHPLLALVESNATGLKSMLKSYIDVTVDNQFASLKNSILMMIQSGMIGPQQSYDVASIGTTLPSPTQVHDYSNTDQSNAECLVKYSNDQLTRTQEHQNILQKDVPLANTINTNPKIKQEFDDDEEEIDENEKDGEEIDEKNVAKCEKCEQGICISGNDAEMRENGDEPQHNDHSSSENNQTVQLIISNDISPSPSPTNPINTETLIKQECLQGSSITSIPLDFTNNAALNDISIEQIERQSTQIQTDEFDDNDDDDDNCEGGEDEYLNNSKCVDCSYVNVNSLNCRKRKSDQANTNVKKVNNEKILEVDEDDSNGNDTNNETRNKSIATECTTNPTQPNLAQPNRHLQCQHCHKSFVSKSKLECHLRVHTGERPFQCNQCDKQFTQLSNLTSHQLIHQNIKRFKCDQCNKKFNKKFNLENHLRTHSGERQHQCTFCNKSFTTWDARNRHEQAIQACGHTATQRSTIITHIRVVHFGLPQTIREQLALKIVDDRDPRKLVEKV